MCKLYNHILFQATHGLETGVRLSKDCLGIRGLDALARPAGGGPFWAGLTEWPVLACGLWKQQGVGVDALTPKSPGPPSPGPLA